ncbi:GntR family transcriptional regulator [Phyllobacterium chamaecytisi]|uniref:GntR family transcriptional regulator n=1 Tax=Phyllobacterium chamaecytisi TaxID=2876082 RepID=UPI001CCE3FE6|nr:GntR family transcriptional regulator [Phyllobacterium sp. KW56]MBZ9603146.1 GntR family transcriptional regulator [Phyllobacterium sp. KW56]
MIPTKPNFSGAQLDEGMPKALQVYELLRAAIISMQFAPGEGLVERDLADELGVSRTPVREAILRLAGENLIIVKRSGGTFVNKIILRQVLEGQLVRDTLEMRVVQLAARNFRAELGGDFEAILVRQKAVADRKEVDEFFALDNEFHKLICTCSGYPNAWKTIHAATGQLDRVRRYAFPRKDNFEKVFREHSDIYTAIKMRDEKTAAGIFQIQLDSTFPTIELLRNLDSAYVVDDGINVSVSDLR